MTHTPDIELENTYLAKELPAEVNGVTPKRLVDVYVPEFDSDHPCLRIRQKGDSYEITKKHPVTDGDASVQFEATIPLDQKEFRTLAASSNRRVVKDRYNVTIHGSPAEVDVFRENLEGLVLIDFEFNNEEERARFVVPDVCLVDVTQEEFIAGGLLAGKSYDDIAERLQEFGYTPIR